jgi:hypothetical protein
VDDMVGATLLQVALDKNGALLTIMEHLHISLFKKWAFGGNIWNRP